MEIVVCSSFRLFSFFEVVCGVGRKEGVGLGRRGGGGARGRGSD
jgi:hypothetical protein